MAKEKNLGMNALNDEALESASGGAVVERGGRHYVTNDATGAVVDWFKSKKKAERLDIEVNGYKG